MTAKNRSDRKKQLESELNSIIAEETAERAEKKRQIGKLMLTNIDFLLSMTPDHYYLGCSDINLDKYRCHRCALLAIKSDKYITEWLYEDVAIDIVIDIKH